MDPTQKRRNPFDVILEERINETETHQRPEPSYVQPQTSRATKQQSYQPPKPVYQQQTRSRMAEETQTRDKYTSTMERSLRRQIKIACVNKGILFAQFIEEACREKLEREGMM